MERRKFLVSVGAGSVSGLAGCSGVNTGDSDDSTNEEDAACTPPAGDSLEDSLPDSDDYEMQGDPTTSSGEQDNIESTVSAIYTGADDADFLLSIAEFSSSDAASAEADNIQSEAGNVEEAFGYIVTGKYVFLALGPDERTVTSFMKASPTLSDGCVDNSLEFIQGSTPETELPSGSITFNDQTTDGSYVNVARVETEAEAIIQIYDSQEEFLANPDIRFEPGEVREDIQIQLSEPLSQSQELSAQLLWCEESGPETCNGPGIATASATLTVE